VEVVRKQISSALDIMVHLSRLRDRTRRVMEIAEVVGVRDGEILLNPLFRFEENGPRKAGAIEGALKRTDSKLVHKYKLDMAGISLSLADR